MSASKPVQLNESQQIAKPGTAEPVRKPAVSVKTVDTIESMKPEAEGASSWKMWFVKLPGCIGDFFAWLFGIKKEGTEAISVNNVPKLTSAEETQAKNIKDCLDPFAKANPDTAAVTKAHQAFGQLDVKAKLEVIQKLQANANCTHAQLLPFVKLCPANQLHAYIEKKRSPGDTRKGADILEANAKDGAVIGAVNVYVVDEQNKADTERQKKILANYAGPDFPAADVCRSSLDCFIAIEGDKGRVETLQLLMGRDNISDAHIVQFVATLPARPKATVVKPAEGDTAEAQPAEPALLRDQLFDKLKAQFGAGEAVEQEKYAEVQEKYAKAAAKAASLNVTIKEVEDPAPVKFDRLEDYFAARHTNLRIRQEVDTVLAATLKEIGV